MQKRTVKVAGHFEETIHESETRFVLGNVDETLNDHEMRLMTGGMKETRTGDERRIVTSGQAEESFGDLTQLVVGSVTEVLHGSLTTTAHGPVSEFTPATAVYTGVGFLSIISGGTMTILAPPSLRWNTANRVEFEGTVTEDKVFAIGITGLSTTTVGTNTAMALMQIESIEAKADAFDVVIGVNGTLFSMCRAEATATGVKVNMGAFRCIVAGLEAFA